MSGRRSLTALAVALCVCATCGSALGAPRTSMSAAFSPERLGSPTALSLGFDVRMPGGELPPALTGIDFFYPPQLGLATSGLGFAPCDPTQLAHFGPSVCPTNSVMGTGTALARFQVSPEISEEVASIGLFAGPSNNGYLKLLISASGLSPVVAVIVMPTVVLPGELRITVPLVPGIPEGPDVAVVRARITLGGNLTYYRLSHGRRVSYHPTGIALPRSCPRGGFRFRAIFHFLDGSSAAAHTVVHCPRARS